MKKLVPLLMSLLLFPSFALAEEGPEAPKQEADELGPAEEEETPATKFLDGLDWQVMASAAYLFSGLRAAGPYNTLGYPYTQNMGFTLNFAGGDVSYTGEKFGVTLNLRWGNAAGLLTPLVPIKQGYVSWMPADRVSFDLGFFDTVYGAEVADEWNNANYSRGALYFLRQPFNHMGLRTNIEIIDVLGLTVLVTNGGVLGGTPIDGNEVPTIGWQLAYAPTEKIGLYAGWQHGANGLNGNKDWEHFFDVVFTWAASDKFTLIVNQDTQIDPNIAGGTGSVTSVLYGVSVAGIVSLADQWSLGLRGEYLGGNDNSGSGRLGTGTVTIRYSPVEYLVLSLEGRLDGSDNTLFFSRTTDATGAFVSDKKTWGGIILGASGHFGN